MSSFSKHALAGFPAPTTLEDAIVEIQRLREQLLRQGELWSERFSELEMKRRSELRRKPKPKRQR